ncbi:MAG: DUF3306 domain-containing protein [Yoonia sp.]|nr:DUF3306 domain-containing protein [Loktanella sp.]
MSDILPSWSRRRAAVASEAKAEALAAEQALLEKEHAELSEKSDEDILEALGLPDPDSLVQGDDFKVFLSKAVPAHLRKRALRTLWRSNPVLACVDGLNDYDDDYLTGSFGQDPIKTTYQVGKGMLAHLLEVERQKEAALTPDAIEEVVAEPECQTPEVDAYVAVVEDVPEPMEEPMPTPRRMQFQFEGDLA